MSTPIIDLDLARQAPRSPRERIAGFVIASRAIDKCRASLVGTPGEYLYDCSLDNMLFNFKGISGEQFKEEVRAAANYEDVGLWLQTNGTAKTPGEIKSWSDAVEAGSPMTNPGRRAAFITNCRHVGLNPNTSTTFDWLEADDLATFKLKTS